MNQSNEGFEILAASEMDKKLKQTEEKYIKRIENKKEKFDFREDQETLKLIPKYMIYMEYMV